MNKRNRKPYWYALIAAALYALSAPLGKILMEWLSPTMMAALLYLGAGAGMTILGWIRSRNRTPKELPLTHKEIPYAVGMILLDILAPILLMLGLALTTAENTSLLNNFEIVATSLVAMLVFGEMISRKLWIGIGFITVASIILSFESLESFRFSPGSVLVLLATVCWGWENNLTRKMSSKDPLQIVVLKGWFSGLGALLVAILWGQTTWEWWPILAALVLGFVAYGLSIFFYVHSQRVLGAAKTSAFYAIAPFIGVVLSFVIFQELPGWSFFIALAVMIVGTWFASRPVPAPPPLEENHE